MSHELILVTGGAGYIGSHTVRALQQANYKVIVLDNLVYGHRYIVEQILKVPLVVGQVGDRDLLNRLLSGLHPSCFGQLITAVIHFAAYAYVGESVIDPAKYYRNNLGDSLTLVEAIKAETQRRSGNKIPLVFSSTCATYGIPNEAQIPITENTTQLPINPYGRTKCMVEQLIMDFGLAYNMPNVIFRYFNAAGAHPFGDLGEDHTPETHLIPLTLSAASKKIPYIQIFGVDYSTPDGTCIRDYIHVCDLADAHVLGLEYVLAEGGSHVYNLGNGKGYSVKEVIDLANRITGVTIPTKISSRREGDPPVLVASAEKAKNQLGWDPMYTQLSDIIKHAWNWHSINS